MGTVVTNLDKHAHMLAAIQYRLWEVADGSELVCVSSTHIKGVERVIETTSKVQRP